MSDGDATRGAGGSIQGGAAGAGGVSRDGTERGDLRLHPWSWLFATAKGVRGLIVPALLVLFASGGSNYELWATIFVLPALIGALVRQQVFRYRLGAEAILVRDGVLTRTERNIPYSRIQNIDLVQNPFHRALGVAVVQVETASGGKPEAVMRVLAVAAVEEMRARVFATRDPAAPEPQEAGTTDPQPVASQQGWRVLLHLPAGEIAKLGIVSNKGLVVVGAATGLVWQQFRVDWFDRFEETVGSGREWLTGLAGSSLLFGVVTAFAAVLVAVVGLRLLSVAWYLVQLHGFTVRRGGDELRAEYGLFNRVTRTIPTRRIQALEATESALHRWLGRQSIELQTVRGGGGGDGDADLEGGELVLSGMQQGGLGNQSQWLAPMIPSAQVPELLRQVDEDVRVDGLQWEPIAARAWRRVFARWMLACSALALLGALFIDPWVLAGLPPAALLVLAHAHLLVRNTAYALPPWGVVFRSGWWKKTMRIVRYAKIQTVARSESPFDRRHRMASVLVDTAGGGMVLHTIEIPYLDRGAAEQVHALLYAEASRREFHW